MAIRTYKLKIKNSLFYKYINKQSDLVLLPLTHKKDCFQAKKIIENGIIKTTECDVFQEKVEYLFYGRPAYYVSLGVKSRMDSVYLPVCFIIKPETVKIDAVFPFDTGAFANEMYDDFIHQEMDVNDFQLPVSTDFLNNFVCFYYGNNDNYYKGKHKTVISDSNLPEEISSYQNMLNNKGETKYDSRCRTIEIITKSDIILSESIEAIILPNDLKRTLKCEDFQKKNKNVKLITYDTFGDDPGSYNAVIRDKMYSYLCDEGYID